MSSSEFRRRVDAIPVMQFLERVCRLTSTNQNISLGARWSPEKRQAFAAKQRARWAAMVDTIAKGNANGPTV